MPRIARMNSKSSIVLGVALMVSLCAGAWAQEKNHVNVELIADTSSVRAGESFEIAVRFVIDEGWHLYWTNPGDSGLPPRVEWKVPDGVKIEALRFPTPSQIDAGGGLTSYGYERELVLLAKVTTPKTLTTPLAIEAEIRWLVCKGVCLTEKQSASLSVPVGEPGKPDERFAGWRSLMPTPGTVAVTNEAKDGKTGVLVIRLSDEMRDPEFYSTDADATFSNPRRDAGVLKVEYKRFDTNKTSAPALLAYTDTKTGVRRSIEFTYQY